MAQPEMPGLLGYMGAADRQFAASYDRVLVIRDRLLKERKRASKVTEAKPMAPVARADNEIASQSATADTSSGLAQVSADQHGGSDAEARIQVSGEERTAAQPNQAADTATDAAPTSSGEM